MSNQKSSPDRKSEKKASSNGQKSKKSKNNENQDIVQEDDAEDDELHDQPGVLPENAQGGDKALMPSSSTLAHYGASIQALGLQGQSPLRNAVLHRNNVTDMNKG